MQLKTLLGAALLLLAGAAQAQTIPETTPEPEFIGEIVTVRPDGTVAKLEKQSVQMRTRANARPPSSSVSARPRRNSSSKGRKPACA